MKILVVEDDMAKIKKLEKFFEERFTKEEKIDIDYAGYVSEAFGFLSIHNSHPVMMTR